MQAACAEFVQGHFPVPWKCPLPVQGGSTCECSEGSDVVSRMICSECAVDNPRGNPSHDIGTSKAQGSDGGLSQGVPCHAAPASQLPVPVASPPPALACIPTPSAAPASAPQHRFHTFVASEGRSQGHRDSGTCMYPCCFSSSCIDAS
eukprot:1141435-Pelagomonas_calceolata.AAC.3